MESIPLWWFLMVAAGLFSTGLFGVLTRRNAVNVLMCIELMLNAVNLQAVAMWRFTAPTAPLSVGGETGRYLVGYDGQLFAVFVIALAAAEAAVGLALIIAIYRQRKTVMLDEFNLMRG